VIVVGFAAGLLALAALLLWPSFTSKLRRARVAENTYALEIAILRYKFDNAKQSVPDSIEDLVRTNHLTELPLNPYTGQPVQSVRISDTNCAGNYTYLPTRIVRGSKAPHGYEAESADSFYGGYLLFGYGDSASPPSLNYVGPVGDAFEQHKISIVIGYHIGRGERQEPISATLARHGYAELAAAVLKAEQAGGC
jgi:hypothetical protein